MTGFIRVYLLHYAHPHRPLGYASLGAAFINTAVGPDTAAEIRRAPRYTLPRYLRRLDILHMVLSFENRLSEAADTDASALTLCIAKLGHILRPSLLWLVEMLPYLLLVIFSEGRRAIRV